MDAMTMLSLSGSVFSTAWTAYFWLVRVRRERPALKPYLVGREIFYGVQRPPNRQLGIKLSLVVANYSLLPNALLGARVWLRRGDGGWQPVQNPAFDARTPLPFNLSPAQTALLGVNGTLWFPIDDQLEDGGLPAYLRHHLGESREIKVELLGLNGKPHTSVLTEPAAGSAVAA
jgi:hypothetical protein